MLFSILTKVFEKKFTEDVWKVFCLLMETQLSDVSWVFPENFHGASSHYNLWDQGVVHWNQQLFHQEKADVKYWIIKSQSMSLWQLVGRSPGEGYSNPLQYSCLENPMDRGPWWATLHWVSKSWTRLKWLSTQRQVTHMTYQVAQW